MCVIKRCVDCLFICEFDVCVRGLMWWFVFDVVCVLW